MDTHTFNNLQGNKLDDQFATNTGAPMMKDTSPGGIHTNVGGQDYYVNYKSDLLTTPNFAQMKTHSLENSLRHSQDQMSQLSHQWGMEARRTHDLANTFASGSQTSSSIGTDDANNLRKAQELSTAISASLSADGRKFGFGAGVEGNISSASSASLDHNLSEYKRVANELSHSSNREISDAFSEASNLSDTTSQTKQEVISKSQALSDVLANQSAINTNMSNDFSNYLRTKGYDPNNMSAMEQAEIAKEFVDKNISSTTRLGNSLQVPPSKLKEVGGTPQLDTKGLQRPSSANDSVATHKAQVQAAIDEFRDHQGNTIGNQIKEQGTTLVNSGKDVVSSLKNIVDKVTTD